jgi:hypothetical protein
MLDTAADTWYTWLGLVAASLAAGGVVAGLPTAVPPDAEAVAATVDGVAASPYDEHERVAVSADAMRLDSRGLTLRSGGGKAHATFARRATPVGDGPLAEVLRGAPPESVYRTRESFSDALREARARESEWQPAPEGLTVRRVAWGEVDATLVG